MDIDPNLQLSPVLFDIVEEAVLVCPHFKIIEGIRTPERQQELFAVGASKTLNSKHLTGNAIDFIPSPFTGWDDIEGFEEIGECFKDISPLIVYGGDWGWDYGHVEIQENK